MVTWSKSVVIISSLISTLYITIVIFLSIYHVSVWAVSHKPNLIFILVDDLGWNDVSWNNKDMPTPNLEKLANEGIRLDQAYSQQVCTPSRAALMTGKYPFHIGRQKRALKPLQPTGLHLNLTTLPQELKKLGYNTHIVGKWHLGRECILCTKQSNIWNLIMREILAFYLWGIACNQLWEIELTKQ